MQDNGGNLYHRRVCSCNKEVEGKLCNTQVSEAVVIHLTQE